MSMADLDSGEDWEEHAQRGFKREREEHVNEPPQQRRRAEVERLRRQWDQLVSINQNRRREGLPPMMSLPASQIEASSSQGPVLFSMAETEQTVETSCPDLISAEVLFKTFQNLEGAVQKQVVEKISQEAPRLEDQQVLLEQIEKD